MQLGISRKGYEILVRGELVKAAGIGVSRHLILIFFELRILVCTCLLALNVCMTDVIQLAFLVSTVASLGEIRTFEDMSFVTLDTFLAITKKSKRAADKSAGRRGYVGISACLIRAITVDEVCAGWHTIVRRLVGEVAKIPACADSFVEERLTHRHLVRVVVKATFDAERTRTCEHVRVSPGRLPAADVSWHVKPVFWSRSDSLSQ